MNSGLPFRHYLLSVQSATMNQSLDEQYRIKMYLCQNIWYKKKYKDLICCMITDFLIYLAIVRISRLKNQYLNIAPFRY
jgi:hypothetical protein